MERGLADVAINVALSLFRQRQRDERIFEVQLLFSHAWECHLQLHLRFRVVRDELLTVNIYNLFSLYFG